jgi:hypothetical protein
MADDTNFREKETDSVSLVMTGLSVATALLLIALTGLLIWCGWTEKPFLTTVAWTSVAWIGLKVLKRYFNNLSTDLAKRSDEGDDEKQDETPTIGVKLSSPRTFVLLIIGGLLPALLWYGVGYGLGVLFR